MPLRWVRCWTVATRQVQFHPPTPAGRCWPASRAGAATEAAGIRCYELLANVVAHSTPSLRVRQSIRNIWTVTRCHTTGTGSFRPKLNEKPLGNRDGTGGTGNIQNLRFQEMT